MTDYFLDTNIQIGDTRRLNLTILREETTLADLFQPLLDCHGQIVQIVGVEGEGDRCYQVEFLGPGNYPTDVFHRDYLTERVQDTYEVCE